MRQTNTRKESRTNWRKLAALPDDRVDTSEVPELDEEFFREATLRLPKAKQLVSIRVDSDVLDWFRQQGKGYQTRINAILRAYVRAHKQ
jgi:uncharacterized protein (DUF4415 family)